MKSLYAPFLIMKDVLLTSEERHALVNDAIVRMCKAWVSSCFGAVNVSQAFGCKGCFFLCCHYWLREEMISVEWCWSSVFVRVTNEELIGHRWDLDQGSYDQDARMLASINMLGHLLLTNSSLYIQKMRWDRCMTIRTGYLEIIKIGCGAVPSHGPYRSPDLSLIDYFRWGVMKSIVYDTPVTFEPGCTILHRYDYHQHNNRDARKCSPIHVAQVLYMHGSQWMQFE